MKATKTIWSAGDRVPLAEVLPLRTPLSIQFEPSAACNFRCSYCLRQCSGLEHKNAIMPFSLFKKFAYDCLSFEEPIKTLMFARMGEPTLNPQLPDMIALAKKLGIARQIKVITNGSVLSPDYNLRLIDAGLDVLRISLQGLTPEQYWSVCHYRMDMDLFKDNIRHFYEHRGSCTVFIKILDKMAEGHEQDFYTMFGDICDEISIEHLIEFKSVDSATPTDINMMGQAIEGVVTACPMPFYSMQVCGSGHVCLCSALEDAGDFLGNIEFDSICDIWNSEILRQERNIQLEGKRFARKGCSICDAPSYCLQSIDNIDPLREQLLLKYQ